MAGEHDLCRSCSARIVWQLTTSGARQPLDREPDRARGNIVLADVAGVTRCVVLSKGALDQARRMGAELFTSHFATCPNSRRHRRKSG